MGWSGFYTTTILPQPRHATAPPSFLRSPSATIPALAMSPKPFHLARFADQQATSPAATANDYCDDAWMRTARGDV